MNAFSTSIVVMASGLTFTPMCRRLTTHTMITAHHCTIGG